MRSPSQLLTLSEASTMYIQTRLCEDRKAVQYSRTMNTVERSRRELRVSSLYWVVWKLVAVTLGI